MALLQQLRTTQGTLADGYLSFLDLDDRGGGQTNGKMSLLPGEAGSTITRTGQSWSTGFGQPATVTYAFRSNAPGTMPSDTSGFSRFSEAQINATQLMLQAWSDVAGITFQRSGSGTTGEGAYSDSATMLFSNYSSGASGAAAFAYLPSTSALGGDVWINSSLAYNSAPTYLAYGYQVLVHEIGHAIGLSHPGAYNAGEGVSLTYSQHAQYYEDSRQYSVMSYFSEGWTTGNFLGRYSSAPLLDDIAAAQRLYGANTATRLGDTTYGFNSTADRIWFDAASGGNNQAVIFAVWDAGGEDTFDFSGYAQNGVIDLRQGHFSSVGGLLGNVSIAMGVTIERAIGGSGADTLNGNSANNVLTGGGGDDQINGGMGQDTAAFSGPMSAYSIVAGVEVVNGVSYRILTVSGPAGTDVLRNIEFLQFADGTVSAAAAAAGVIVEGDVTNDTFTGTIYADVISGADGVDTLNGDAGDDIINGGRGDDVLNGGSGIDTADYSTSTSGVIVNLTTGLSAGGAGADTLTAFENVTGTRFNDYLYGNAGANTIRGGGGNDVLSGEGGNDHLIAGAGAVGADDVHKAATTANTSRATAVNIDGNFDIQDDAGINNATTVPHAVIRGSGAGGGVEYYAFTVGAGAACVFDIGTASFDSVLRIYDANGNELASNDDEAQGTTNSLINFTFATAGTYYVAVGAWTQAQGTNAPVPAGGAYTLAVSVPGHAYRPAVGLGSELYGGDGDDLLESGSANDTMDGGSGSDTAVFAGARSQWTVTDNGGGVFTISNGIQTDTVRNVEFAQFADQTITLIAPSVTPPITGTAGNDSLNGTSGNDIIHGLNGNDTLNGLDGDDLLFGGGGADALNGGAGIDTAWYETGVVGGQLIIDLATPSNNNGEAAGDTYSSIERIVGSTGADIIRGTAASEVFQGRGGQDIFLGRGGGDWFDGGADVDTVWYDGQAVIDLRDWGSNSGAAAGDRYDSIERIVSSNASDIIRGTSASEIFQGRGGDDIFLGRGGGDWFDGGDGLDTVWYDEAVVADLADWTTNGAAAAGDRYDSIERVVGSNFNDVIRGTTGRDFFTGRGGDDIFQGRGGNDWFDGGDGVDTVWYDTQAVIDLQDWTTNSGGAAGDRYDFIERVVSSNADDIIRGSSGVDYFVARGGNDVMEGRGGADWFDGGDGIDTVWYSTGVGPGQFLVIDMIDFGRSTGEAAGDRFFNVERIVSSNMSDYVLGTQNQDFILTRDGDDAVEGRGGNDVIDTGIGNDRIHGGLGADNMVGGAGLDAFVYLGANEGGDVIADFVSGQDKVELYAPGFSVGSLPSNWFVAGTQANAANAQVIWNAANRTLSFDADGTGAGAAVVLATFGGAANLVQSDVAWSGLPAAAVKLDAPWVSPDESEGPQILPGLDKDMDEALVLPGLTSSFAKDLMDDPQICDSWNDALSAKTDDAQVLPGADTKDILDQPQIQPGDFSHTNVGVDLPHLDIRSHFYHDGPGLPGDPEVRPLTVGDDWIL